MFDEPRLLHLLDAYCDQTLSATERAELEQSLLSSAPARELFWQHARFNALAREWGLQERGLALATQCPEPAETDDETSSAENVVELPAEVTGTLHSGRAEWWTWAGVAAAVLALLGFSGFLFLRQPPSRVAPAEPVALLAATAGVEWAKGQPPLAPNTSVAPGPLRLRRGLVRLDFYTGAQVVLEGPAELDLVSASAARLRSGRARIFVPDAARGFTIHTPQADAVDYGTDFGVSVSAQSATEVHVFSGHVGVTATGGPYQKTELNAGQAVRAELASWQTLPADASAFPDPQQLTREARAESTARQATWLKSAKDFSASPDLVVHFRFEPQDRRGNILSNSAAVATAPTHAAIVGCEWTEGRWPGKGAVAFTRVSDRLRFIVPTEMPQATFMAWVRVDQLPNALNVLLFADGREIGAADWQIDNLGRVRLGFRTDQAVFTVPDSSQSTDWDVAVSPPVFTRDRMEGWTHLATVFSAEARQITHYVNGEVVAAHSLKRPRALRLAAMHLGNCRPDPTKPPRESIRNLFGRFDEFLLFSRALPATEIRQHYESGRP